MRRKEKTEVKWNNYTVEFNRCRLGVAFAAPCFLLQPEGLPPVGGSGEGRFAGLRQAVVRIELDAIDDGFARLIGADGRLRGLDAGCFQRTGELELSGLDSDFRCRLRGKLPDRCRYRDDRSSGRKLELEFELEADGLQWAMVRREAAG